MTVQGCILIFYQREIENRKKEGGNSDEEKIPIFLEKLFR